MNWNIETVCDESGRVAMDRQNFRLKKDAYNYAAELYGELQTIRNYLIEKGRNVRIRHLNDLAIEITKREGKKISISIAQVKEVLRVIGDIAAEKTCNDRIEIGLMVVKEKRPPKKYRKTL